MKHATCIISLLLFVSCTERKSDALLEDFECGGTDGTFLFVGLNSIHRDGEKLQYRYSNFYGSSFFYMDGNCNYIYKNHDDKYFYKGKFNTLEFLDFSEDSGIDSLDLKNPNTYITADSDVGSLIYINGFQVELGSTYEDQTTYKIRDYFYNIQGYGQKLNIDSYSGLFIKKLNIPYSEDYQSINLNGISNYLEDEYDGFC